MEHLKINSNQINSERDLNHFNNNYLQGKWFVKFYAEWCGHCQAMEKEWTSATNDNDFIKQNNINVVEIENTQINNDTNKIHQPIGFPTIIYYHDGQRIDYNGKDRTAKSFIKFLKQYNKSDLSKKQSNRRQSKKKRLSKQKQSKKASSSMKLDELFKSPKRKQTPKQKKA